MMHLSVVNRLKHRAKAAAIAMLRDRHELRAALLRAAARRNRALVLCYHTVGLARPASVAVPEMHPHEFEAQMAMLKSLGEVVPLDWLLRRSSVPLRPQFAVTFDDDDPAHVDRALPILQKYCIHATFFLSGRSLHGLGAYWWIGLEHFARASGLEAACRAAGVYAPTLKALIRRCRHHAVMQDVPITPVPPAMDASQIRMLSEAGMAIGFHTLNHPRLTRLPQRDLRQAVTVGRDALAAAARVPVEMFAYPYGDVDRRVAAAVREAGYSAAVALSNRPVSARCDRFDVPRWQPRAAGVADFAGEAALRLNTRDQ